MTTHTTRFENQFISIVRAARIILTKPSNDLALDCAMATGLLQNVQIYFSRDKEKLVSEHLSHLSAEQRKGVFKLLKMLNTDIGDIKAVIFMHAKFPEQRDLYLEIMRVYFGLLLQEANLCVRIVRGEDISLNPKPALVA